MDDLFKLINDDIFAGVSKKSRLQKKGDTAFELNYLMKELSNQGKKPILYETTKKAETIIVYKDQIDEDALEIILRSRIFSKEGNNSFTPSMILLYKKKCEILEIADLRVEVPDANKGYGSALMRAMFLFIEQFPYPIKYITGWISSTDWDHIDRNKFFYEKFGFEVELNYEIKEGNILWINPKDTRSIEEYQSLNYKTGIAGLMQEYSENENGD